MSTQTTNLQLHKPSLTDSVHSTINGLSVSMQTLDDVAELSSDGVPVSGTWDKYKRVWNKSATLAIGDPSHYINLRAGVAAPKWTSLKSYALGDHIVSNTDNSHYYTCIQPGYGCKTEPTLPLTSGTTVKDINGSSYWETEKYYAINTYVIPTNDNDRFYVCVQAGNAGTTEPTWGTTVGADTTDGGVKWRCYTVTRWQESGTSANFRPAGVIS